MITLLDDEQLLTTVYIDYSTKGVGNFSFTSIQQKCFDKNDQVPVVKKGFGFGFSWMKSKIRSFLWGIEFTLDSYWIWFDWIPYWIDLIGLVLDSLRFVLDLIWLVCFVVSWLRSQRQPFLLGMQRWCELEWFCNGCFEDPENIFNFL